MKVVFVNLPVVRSEMSAPENEFKLEEKVRYGVRAGSRWPWMIDNLTNSPNFPFFMAYSAAYLKHNGIDVDLMDAVVDEEYSYDNFLKRLKEKKPEITIIETSTPTIDIDLWMADKISAFSEVCLAGPHATYFAEDMIREHRFIKYILKGEYILNALDMIKRRSPGIYECRIVENLDSIPFPFRDFEGAHLYYEPTMPTPRRQLQLMASKGCPFNCIYCMWPQVMYNKSYSVRDPKMIAREIRECKDKHGYGSILFDDDTFNIGDERISELCDELAKIGMPWTMIGRLDTSPEWIFDKMVDSGCVGMRFGVETFDVQVLKNIKKGLKRKDVFRILEYITIKHPQVMIHLTMMKNLPGQTEEIHQSDLKMLENLGYSITDMKRSYQMASCMTFPGTELYERR